MRHILTALGALALTTTAATAGGFERSTNSVAFMYEKGNYAELSFGYVAPKVSGSAGGGLSPTGNISESYTQLGVAFKMDVNEKLALGLQIDPSFGADITYPLASPGPVPYQIRGTNATLNGDTIALMAKYKVTDNISVHGGLRSVGIGGDVGLWVRRWNRDHQTAKIRHSGFSKWRCGKYIGLRVDPLDGMDLDPPEFDRLSRAFATLGQP